MPPSNKFLIPDVIARLRGLEFRRRSIAAGYVSGQHRSAYHGFSVEFAEHRPYVQGDDIRHVDWRIYRRADRYYIKQYEEETNLRCNFLVDASHSMAYCGKHAAGRSKFEYGACLAASLAFVLNGQQDAAGLITFDHDVRDQLSPATGRGHLADFNSVLERTQPAEQTHVKALLHRLADELHRRSMVVLVSDLLADPDAIISGIEHLSHVGHELIVLHVMDDDEWDFPFVENILFEGLEDDVRLLTDPQSLRRSYLDVVQRFVSRVEKTCLRNNADYVPVNTRDPLNVVLCGYLARRAGRASRTVRNARQGGRER